MISNLISQQHSSYSSGQAISKSLMFSTIVFIILIFINSILGFSLAFVLWIENVGILIVFLYLESEERKTNEKLFLSGFYPPEYSYFKSLLIGNLFLFFLSILLSSYIFLEIFYLFLSLIISALIAIIPYMRTYVKNQKIELQGQKTILEELAKKIETISIPSTDQQIKPKFDSKTGKPLLNQTLEEIKPSIQTVKKFKPRFDSQTGKPLFDVDQQEKISDDNAPISNLRTENQIRTIPENEIFLTKPEEQISIESSVSYLSNVRLSHDTTSLNVQISNRTQPSHRLELFENFSKKYSNYLFFGAIVFIVIAGLAWVLVLFPTSTQITLGPQTWIAGDTIVLVGLLIILISEFILTKSKYSELIPINYLGIGIGLGIGILGLLSIRFGVMPIFLSDTGLIDKNYLFFLLAILIASLSWIYAWRSPYRDLIFGSLISGFILVDYSFQFKDTTFFFIGLLSGLIFIMLPGIHASFSEVSDNRFFLGGLIVYNLILLKTDNIIAILEIEKSLYLILILIPVITFIALFSLQKISSIYVWLCFTASAFTLISNEIAFVNNYISTEIFTIVFISILILLAVPKIIARQRTDYTLLDFGLNIVISILHVSIISMHWLPNNDWYIICVPVLINTVLVGYEIIRCKIKFEYLLTVYFLTWISLGLFSSYDILFVAILAISLIITYLILKRDYQQWRIFSFMAVSYSLIILSSLFSTFSLWEVTIIPFIIPVLFILIFISKNRAKRLYFDAILLTMIVQVIFTITQSIFASYILIEYAIVIILFGIYLIVQKSKQENDTFYWFILYIGFLGCLVYAEYDSLFVYGVFCIISIQSFIIMVIYLSEFSAKKVKQLFYDGSNTILFSGLFSLIILEKFVNDYFIVALAIFITINVFIVWYLLRFSGIDFTLGILLPSLLVIGKELYVTQFLAQDINPLFSLLEFAMVAVSAFCLALLSRRIIDYQSLISPNITAMFSIELLLIVLFVNKIIVDYFSLGTFIGLLTLIILVNFVQKHLDQLEYFLIIVSSLILAMVIPVTENMRNAIYYIGYLFNITLPQDTTYFTVVLISLPVFWFILRLKVNKLHILIDLLLTIFLVSAEYLISLRLPNNIFVQSGLVTIQLTIFLMILSLLIRTKKNSIQDKLNNFIIIQIPFWVCIGIFFDLELHLKLLYSQFIDLNPVNDILILKLTLIALFIGFFILFFINRFESHQVSINNIGVGIISIGTLGVVLVQLFLNQLQFDTQITALFLILLLVFLELIAIFSIKQQNQIQSSNIVILFAAFYILLTVALFLLTNGLISGLIAVLGTSLIILGLGKNFIKELQLVGGLYLVSSIGLILFNIVNNFNVMVLEIAVTSSIVAICLLLIGMIVNYRTTRVEQEGNNEK